jgi:hypothetical protein
LLLCAWLAVASPLLSGGVDRDSAFSDRVLAAHNRERARMGVSALGWDERLAAGAEAWARQLARTGVLRHAGGRGTERLGENLWAGTAQAYSPEEMVGLWVDERADFRPGAFPHVSRTGDLAAVGHYTQVIWRRTSRVGCALASNGREEFLVCRYSLPGNVVGERPI